MTRNGIDTRTGRGAVHGAGRWHGARAMLCAVLCSGLFGLGLSSGAAGAPVLYDCDLSARDPGVDWISAKYGFVVEGDTVSVVDNIVLLFVEEPVAAQVRVRGSELRLTWTVRVRDADQNTARMSYRAWLDTEAKTARVRVRPVGIPQGWSGSGTCTTRAQ